MTSNPAIFEKAIVESHDYDQDLQDMAREGKASREIYEALSRRDVQSAADVFRPLYDKTDGKDGCVSLEVDPRLAHDTKGTIEEARRLWGALNRPNVFIEVPGTAGGLPAIKQLAGAGVNVNVTLLFGLPHYRKAVEACLGGLEARLAQGKNVSHVASVASFFVSRIDALVDPLLEKIIAPGGPASGPRPASARASSRCQRQAGLSRLKLSTLTAIMANPRHAWSMMSNRLAGF